jgi:phage regulator Rha-like protein
MNKNSKLFPAERIVSKIYLIRNEKVLLDSDLADLYGVETKRLKEAVRRNIHRFPADFMFQLSPEEQQYLRSQIASLKRGQHSKYPPFVFTEQGVAMLSGVLNSKRAIQVNIAIMRVFVQMRKFMQSTEVLARKLDSLEKETREKFADNEKQIRIIFEAIKQLISEKEIPKRKIGF